MPFPRRGPAEHLARSVARTVDDPRVLAAIRDVPRDAFVPTELASSAWDDRALPIAEGQTISQPSVVAQMCAALDLAGGERVLEVGTGSGYHAAVLARLAGHVWSVERHAALSRAAAAALARAGVANVTLVVGDGTRGLPEEAPFDAISVAAAAREVPPALLAQLAPGGRLVMPVGPPSLQELVLVVRRADGTLATRRIEGVRFVPLVEGLPAG